MLSVHLLAAPAIVMAAPAPATSPTGLPTAWDHVFAKWGKVYGIPVAYLRVLAKRESDFQPYNTKGGAWGLLEVVMAVVDGFNKRNPGKNYTSQDRLDPDKNVEMATWQLRQIIKSYRANHSTRNLQENWDNPEFVAILTMGWNSGYSEEAGVGKVVDYLAKNGIPVTATNIAKYATAAGAVSYIAERGSGWAKAVTRMYFADRGGTGEPVALRPRGVGAGAALAVLGLAAASGALGLTLAMRRGMRIARR